MERRGIKRSASTSRGDFAKGIKKFRMTTAKTASLTQKVNKILSEQERKNFDLVGTAVVTSVTGTTTFLGNIPAGDTGVTRDGRRVTLTSSQMKYNVAGGITAGAWRVMVVYDNAGPTLGSTSAPAVTDILETASVLSPMNLSNRTRFTILHDNFQSIGKGDYAAGTNLIPPPGAYYKRMDHTCEFGSFDNVPLKGAVILLVITTGVGSISYYHRARFTDS